jgi:hypothetical protein
VSRTTTLSAAAQANSGIAELQFIVDGKTLCTVKAAPYTCNWTPGAAGYASIEARAVDAMGNIASVSANMQVNAQITPYRALAVKEGAKDVAEGLLTQAATPAAVAVPKVRTAVASRDRSGS